jgi:hypothetical protein
MADMSVLGWCFLIIGVGVLWLLIVFVRLMTRAAVSPREATSAGSCARPRPWRRSAKANGLAGPEAADNGPGGRTAALSGTTITGCVLCAQIDDEAHDDACPRGTLPALDGLGTGDLAQLDYLEAWRRAGCPAVWPIPVVPGKDAA